MGQRISRRIMWGAAAVFLGLWGLLFLGLKLPGSYMHVFLVAAIGVGFMNLIANYWTHPDPADNG